MRTRCSRTDGPASQSHSNGGLFKEHTCRPSTKNRTLDALADGSTRARSKVGPLTYASAPGERICTLGAAPGEVCALASWPAITPAAQAAHAAHARNVQA